MKILLASILPIEDPRSWSGINLNIYKQLSKNHEVHYVYSKNAHALQKRYARKSRWLFKLTKTRLNVYFNDKVAKLYGKELSKQAQAIKPDIILSLGPATSIAYLETNIKTYLIADASFKILQQGYDAHQNLSQSSVSQALEVELKGFKHADKILLSSHWAKASIAADHPELESKLGLTNFGSNLSSYEKFIRDYPSKIEDLKLLIFAHDPKRKGLEHARDLAQRLQCKLLTIGDDTYLDKSTSESVIIDQLKKAHFLLLLSEADCTPIVVNEAASFALPTLAFNVGGVSSIVETKVNGYLLTSIDEAEAIITSMDQEVYRKLQNDTYSFYEEKLSWERFEKNTFADL